MRTIAVAVAMLTLGLAGCLDSNLDADSEAGGSNDYSDHLMAVDLESMTKKTITTTGQVTTFSQGRDLTPLERDEQEFVMPEGAFAFEATLDWDTAGPNAATSDLDFWVRDPDGSAIAQGASLAKPETAAVKRIIQPETWGETWTTDVMNYENPPTSYTVEIVVYLLDGYGDEEVDA